jgi:hypothetical protein
MELATIGLRSCNRDATKMRSAFNRLSGFVYRGDRKFLNNGAAGTPDE